MGGALDQLRGEQPGSPGALRAPHVLAAALVAGLGLSVLLRPDALLGIGCSAALLTSGVTWGAVRLAELDSSDLSRRLGETGQIVAEVSSPVRIGTTRLRMFGRVRTFDGTTIGEPAELEVPASTARPRRRDRGTRTCDRSRRTAHRNR